MKLARVVALGVCVLVILAACSTPVGQSGSNSNWLDKSNWLGKCERTADCGGSLQCWCGVCTAPCTATSDCARLASGATCSSPSEFACSEPVTKKACVFTCRGNADCATIGGGAFCSDYTCQRPARAGDGGVCTGRQSAVTTQVVAILDGADKACIGDSDCVVRPKVRCGDDQCGTPVVSKAGAASVAARLAAIDKDLCEPFFAAGCILEPANCFAVATPKCVAGACVGFFGQSPAGDGGKSLCDSVPDETTNRLVPFLDRADRSCVSDSDCTLSPGVRCGDPCGVPIISKAGAAALAPEIATIEKDLCDPYDAAGCPPPFYGCPLIGTPTCVSGACEGSIQGISNVDGGGPHL